MAMAASYHGVPFLVACQRIKLGGQRHARIEKADELFNDLPPGVTARAPLFDVTPPELVDSVITESGRLSPSEAGQVGEGIAKLRSQILG
jgi:translation initiation factor 2B subunit (eIF-2B alpha/beta/delta family)